MDFCHPNAQSNRDEKCCHPAQASSSFHFPLYLSVTYLFESLHVSKTHIKPARAATTCSRVKKKIKMLPDQLEILTSRAPENLCHRNAAQLCNLVPLWKNKFALKKNPSAYCMYL